jgi:hypothetical protein
MRYEGNCNKERTIVGSNIWSLFSISISRSRGAYSFFFVDCRNDAIEKNCIIITYISYFKPFICVRKIYSKKKISMSERRNMNGLVRCMHVKKKKVDRQMRRRETQAIDEWERNGSWEENRINGMVVDLQLKLLIAYIANVCLLYTLEMRIF